MKNAPRIMVWSTWLLCSLMAVGFVAYFGRNVPHGDDYDLVPQLTGYGSITPDYLWGQHNEHRIPLPKVLLIMTFHAGGRDFRSSMFFGVAILSLVSALLIRAGAGERYHFSDAFFPLVLLNWGQHDNLLWFWQLGFFLPICLVCVILALMIRAEDFPRADIIIGCCLIALPMCGAPGLAFVPALAVWLLALSPSRPAKYLAVASLGLVAFYFVGFHRPLHHPRSPGILASVKTTLQVLSMSWGRIYERLYVVVLVVILGWILATLALLIRACRSDLKAASGLLAILAGCVVVVVGIGWGRAGFSQSAGLSYRYATLGLPLLCTLFVSWKRYLPRFQKVFLPMALVVYLSTISMGVYHARKSVELLDPLEADARAGFSAHELTERYGELVFDANRSADLENAFRGLKQAGVGPFKYLSPDR